MSNLGLHFIIWFHCINTKRVSFQSVAVLTSSVNTKKIWDKNIHCFHVKGHRRQNNIKWAMPYIFRLLQTYSRKEKWWKLWEKRTGTLKGWKFELTWKIVCIHCFKFEYLDVSLYERSDFLKIIWCYLFCMLCSWLLSGFRLFVLICNVKVKLIINKLR